MFDKIFDNTILDKIIFDKEKFDQTIFDKIFRIFCMLNHFKTKFDGKIFDKTYSNTISKRYKNIWIKYSTRYIWSNYKSIKVFGENCVNHYFFECFWSNYILINR